MSERPLVVATIPIVAIAVLVVNDHALKWSLDNAVTGKLSDVAGLVFFPLLVLALLEMVGAGPLRRRAHVVVASIVTAVVFAAIKLSPVANVAYAEIVGVLQWPAWALAAWIDGGPTPGVAPVDCVMDATDLWTLPALAVPIAITRADQRACT